MSEGSAAAPADLNALPLEALFDALVDRRRFSTLINLAFDEDLGDAGDVTTAAMVPADVRATAAIVAREEGIVAGLPALARILEEGPRRGASGPGGSAGLRWRITGRDGQRCRDGDRLVELEGPLAAMLPLERILLNLLGRLSGVATLTRAYVDECAGTRAKLCCTRKTTPGLRELEKYAVRCGGGWLHRIGLYDAMLVKDNHLGAVSAGSLTGHVAEAALAARRRHPLRFVEVEVDTLEQLDAILAIEPGVIDIVLLDNFSLDQLAVAVRRRDARSVPGTATVELEASGGVRLERLKAIAATGVDRISCGAITHGARSLDVALDLLPERRSDRA
jgi:nicotinate-nucleotide pyrophosphorylase (carboxylating)